MTRPLICGFVKARDELIREGNLYRCLKNMLRFCDTIVACDDASTDGTRELLAAVIPRDRLILVPHDEQNFKQELFWKEQMMAIVHRLQPRWIWWSDADEELDETGVAAIRAWCQDPKNRHVPAARFHYTQLWRSAHWARTDDGLDDGSYVKLWRYAPDLSFDVREGTHFYQFPSQIAKQLAEVPELPWEVIHWGNYGTNLRWKCIQYAGGLGGIPRHLDFAQATYRCVAPFKELSQPDRQQPRPFTKAEQARILSFGNLRGLEKTFTVVIPTFNRAAFLPEALGSLLTQTYDKWIALVLDDGSTDNTPEVMREWQDRDPRIFYARYPHQSAVWMNERGCDMACSFTQWWTRLGSDDYFMPNKLELDAWALERYDACYGQYRVLRKSLHGTKAMPQEWDLVETCNRKVPPGDIKERLVGGDFVVSWANVAVRTSVLRKVKQIFGHYVDPSLDACEDFHANSRIARVADFVFRGAGGETHEAIWRVNPIGASADETKTSNEVEMTRGLIQKDNEIWTKRGFK